MREIEELGMAELFLRERRRELAEAKLAEIAPALADAPEQVARFLSNVQRMLVAGSAIEAARFAREVAVEAETVALLHVEHRHLLAKVLERMAGEPLIMRPPLRDGAIADKIGGST